MNVGVIINILVTGLVHTVPLICLHPLLHFLPLWEGPTSFFAAP